jgi:hypothetical protein
LDAIVGFLKRFQRLKPLAMVEIQSFLNDDKKTKCCLLAPIAVKILCGLVFSNETTKIRTNSGTAADEKVNVSAPKN